LGERRHYYETVTDLAGFIRGSYTNYSTGAAIAEKAHQGFTLIKRPTAN
jgi:hypothetical protein